MLEFKGHIDFGNMSLSSRLETLDLSNSKVDGPIPESIAKFRNLEELCFSNSSISGAFPPSLFMIPSLQWVDLAQNQFKGPIDFGNASSSSQLGVLDLADNKFDGPVPESISKFLCLVYLDLSNSKLEGKVPGCLWRLESLKISHNSFSSFEKSSQVLDHSQMGQLRLDYKLSSLKILDLSNNSFNGSIPQCLTNLNDSIEVFILRNNNFSGILPDLFVNTTQLSVLDVGYNRLEGKLPKSLINCKEMELLNVGGNKFKDKFPSWLGSLPSLKILILRSNQFYGPLFRPHISVGFLMLKVIDVSHNDFSGTFPTFYFSNWLGMSQMTTFNEEYGDYMEYLVPIIDLGIISFDSGFYYSSMDIVHKGVDREFQKIRRDFTLIDFSGNKFYGKIPESIGLLKRLRFLSLSSNGFTSNIPQSLANLTNLESLDLSQNQLSGQIPRDLGPLSSISTMNFSHNNLQGLIPQGTQFQRQDCSSFMDNLRLYGLEEICGKHPLSNPTPQEWRNFRSLKNK